MSLVWMLLALIRSIAGWEPEDRPIQGPDQTAAQRGCDADFCGTNGTSRTGLAVALPVHAAGDGAPITAVRRTEAIGGGCAEWACGTNGVALTGLAMPAVGPARVELGGCGFWHCGSNGTSLTGLAVALSV
ncbi:MAG: hypothetical protein ABMB14_39300, partial [Myxococcota bacterium]